MKENKFRAWDKELGIFQDDENIFINQDGGVYREDEGIWYENRYDIQFYTGLRDGKRTEEYPEGQEICDGDIVQYHPEANMGTGEVVYELGAFRVQGDFDALLYHFALTALEVIGNIHDNPELLT